MRGRCGLGKAQLKSALDSPDLSVSRQSVSVAVTNSQDWEIYKARRLIYFIVWKPKKTLAAFGEGLTAFQHSR